MSDDLQSPLSDIKKVSVSLKIGRWRKLSACISYVTKAMVMTIIVFFVTANEEKVGLLTDSAERSNLRGGLRAEKPAFGTSQNEKLDFRQYI